MSYNKQLKNRFLFIIIAAYVLLFIVFYKYNKAYKFVFDSPAGPFLMVLFIGLAFYFNINLGVFVGFSLGLLFLLSKTFKEGMAFERVSMMDPNVDNNLGFSGVGTRLEGRHIVRNKEQQIAFGDGNGAVEYYDIGGSGSGSGNGSGNAWDPKIITDFLQYQHVHNPRFVFDINIIQKQATQKEAETLLNTGMWPWSERVKEIYTDAISRMVISKKGSLKSMNQDRTMYNQTAILNMIAWNENEGKFLMHGAYVENPSRVSDLYSGRGTYGVDSGLVDADQDILRCNSEGKLKRIHNLGNDGITGVHKKQISDADYNELPALVNGFTFIRGACNPCSAMKFPPDYNCPFSLDGGKHVSPVWEQLWGLEPSPIQKMPDGFPYWMN